MGTGDYRDGIHKTNWSDSKWLASIWLVKGKNIFWFVVDAQLQENWFLRYSKNDWLFRWFRVCFHYCVGACCQWLNIPFERWWKFQMKHSKSPRMKTSSAILQEFNAVSVRSTFFLYFINVSPWWKCTTHKCVTI